MFNNVHGVSPPPRPPSDPTCSITFAYNLMMHEYLYITLRYCHWFFFFNTCCQCTSCNATSEVVEPAFNIIIIPFISSKQQHLAMLCHAIASVAPYCGISLLHAAIYLDEPDLVKSLVELGADPAAPSDVGSARMLSKNLLGDQQDQKLHEILCFLTGFAAHTKSNSNNVNFLSELLGADMQDEPFHGSHLMNRVAEQEEGKYSMGGEVLGEEAQPKKCQCCFQHDGSEAPSSCASTPMATSIEEMLAEHSNSLMQRARAICKKIHHKFRQVML